MAGVTTSYQTGVHGSRPAASAGCILYSCTDHGLVYRSDGSSWTTWLTLPSGTVSGAPALTFGTSAAQGAASTFVATDATLPIFDATVPTTQALADAAAAGAAGVAARRDHKHGMPARTALPGGEFDHVEYTAGTVSVTATAEASANTLVTGNAVAYDGATPIIVEFFCPRVAPNTGTAGDYTIIYLFDGSTSIGIMALEQTPAASSAGRSVLARRRITPSNASHTYSARAITNSGTASFYNGAGGLGNHPPMYLRQTRAN